MSITLIQNASMSDVTRELSRMLREGILHPEVRQMALSITQDTQDDLTAIFDWQKANMRYVPDPVLLDGELFISPARQLRMLADGGIMAEDCDGLALMAGSLLGSIGHEVRIKIIDSIGKGWDHAFAECYSPLLEEWLSIDTSADKPVGWILESKNERIILPQ